MRFPRGDTIDIVCQKNLADLKHPGTNNVNNGTSAARGPTRPEGRGNVQVRGRLGANS